MKVAYLLAGACSLLALAGVASAQTPGAQTPGAQTSGARAAKPDSTVPGVTVTAPSDLTPTQQVERFGQVDAKGRLARWDVPVCPAAIGLPPDFDAFLVKRIRTVAEQVGGRTDVEPCQANILVLVTPHPAEVSRRLADFKAHQLAGDRWPLDKRKLEAFATSKDPVRWLFVSDTVQTAGGSAAIPSSLSAGGDSGGSSLEAILGNTAQPGAPQFDHIHPSRLRPAGDEAFTKVVIVVDANRIAGLSAGQVADYLAMASLAHVQAESSFAGTDTVLNLFAPGLDAAHRPAGLTSWDTDYLGALYKSDGQVTYSAQVSHITTRIKAEEAQPAATDMPK